MKFAEQAACEKFLQATSYLPVRIEGEQSEERIYDVKNRPAVYLTYPDAPVQIPLGTPQFPTVPDIWEILNTRRSKRRFLQLPLTLNELNILLWSTQGITADMGGYQLRTAPSAGALYPVETYLLINNVEGIRQGLYHLNVKEWKLEELKTENVREIAYKASMEQHFTKTASVNFIWTAVVERCSAKYFERAYRYVWQDAGHISENLQLAATALGLGVCCIGAFYDSVIHDYLNIDGKNHFAVLLSSAGKVEGTDWRKDRRE